MKKNQNNSARASALQISLSIALLCISAILFASSFHAASPGAAGGAQPVANAQSGFYPPLPAQQNGFYPPLPVAPADSSAPTQGITVSAPIDNFDTSVPISTVILEPVNSTNIDPSLNYIGFQCDLIFDSAIVAPTPANAPVAAAGLTGSGWTVSGNTLNSGPGTLKTIRVSAFVNDGMTPLSGAGALLNIKFQRVSSTPGQTTSLAWSAFPNDFEFIDSDLNSVSPNQTNGQITITGPTPTPGGTATPTASPPPTATPTPQPTATPTPAPTPTPTPQPTATPTPAPTPTPTPQPTATPTPTASPTAQPTATATPAATASPTAQPTATATPAATASPTAQPTATATPAATASPTAQPTATATPAATASPTAQPTATATPAATASPTAQPTATATPAPTASPTAQPTATATPAPTASPTAQPTATATPAATASPTAQPTATATPPPTATPQPTATPPPTATPTPQPTPTPTATPQQTPTPTATPSASPSCPAITVRPFTLPDGTVGHSYHKTITASGGHGPYRFTVSDGMLPTGLTLSLTGNLSGTPTAEGTFTFTILATDTNGCTGKNHYTVTMSCPDIRVKPFHLPDAAVGRPYNKVVVASGGSAPYTFAVSEGSLPTGLTLSPDGTISGTPTEEGFFAFTIIATDANNCTGKRNYTVGAKCADIHLSPSKLPRARVNHFYNKTITASGGNGGYTFTVENGNLPPGLTLSSGGVLFGTPTAGGSFAFTIVAKDGFGCDGKRQYTLVVSDHDDD